jgi:hypothetical protein
MIIGGLAGVTSGIDGEGQSPGRVATPVTEAGA